jgi:hypothetical protein
MRRSLMRLVVVAVMAALAAAMAVPVFAAKGGDPNENACQGQINSTLNTVNGTNPKEGADLLRQLGFSTGNPGDYEKQIREGGFGAGSLEDPIFCPLTP